MALLFADVVAQYNAGKIEQNKPSDTELTNKVADFLDDIDEVNSVFDTGISVEERNKMPQRVFVASIASEYYSKAQEDIANTKVGNKSVRKKNFKQVMQESFFYGSNRFGNNFIA